VKKDPETIPTTRRANLVDMSGTTVAGCMVEAREPNGDGNARWRCICACGERFVDFGVVLREKEKRGYTASCDDCKAKRKLERIGKPNPNLKAYPIAPEHAEPAPVLRVVPEPVQVYVSRVLRWWRLELDAKGSVLSCTAVEHRGEAGERQFLYVEAYDQKEAGRLAWNAYCRLAQARHRAKMTSEGCCPWCGRKQDRKPGRRCNTCLAGDRARAATNKALKAGQNVPAPDAQVTRATRLQSERAEYRLQILGEVRKVALERTPRDFLRWLDEELGLHSGQVTAEKAVG
jgi:hypothetical protein